MTSLDESIQACKQEIRYRAACAHIPYDDEDLRVFSDEWGTVVAITDIKVPRTEVDEDGILVQVSDKRPNIWMAEPNMSYDRRMEESTIFSIKVSYPSPLVQVLIPSLVMIIYPDGSIKSNNMAWRRLQDIVTLETKRWIADCSHSSFWTNL